MTQFWKIQKGGGGVIGKIPSMGGYGYFLELHNMDFQPSSKHMQCVLPPSYHIMLNIQDLKLREG